MVWFMFRLPEGRHRSAGLNVTVGYENRERQAFVTATPGAARKVPLGRISMEPASASR
jgi:hypothetical protein